MLSHLLAIADQPIRIFILLLDYLKYFTYCPPLTWMMTASLPVLTMPLMLSSVPLFKNLYKIKRDFSSKAFSYELKKEMNIIEKLPIGSTN